MQCLRTERNSNHPVSTNIQMNKVLKANNKPNEQNFLAFSNFCKDY